MSRTSCTGRLIGARLLGISIGILTLGGAAHGATSCPTAALLASDSARTVADVGWTGVGHGLGLGAWTLGIALTGCDPTTACGGCRVSGLRDPQGEHHRRCVDQSWIRCTATSDCTAAGASGPCGFFPGPPAPNSAGSIGICTVSVFGGTLDGSVDVGTGRVVFHLPLGLRLHKGPPEHPCPRCVGDPTPGDGVQAGTCDSGARAASACDADAVSPITAFGATSLDCPPATNTMQAITRPSDPIDLTTDAHLIALTSTSPLARARGFTQLRNLCDVCANDPNRPCRSDADCGSGSCGSAEGKPTALNACDDAVCTLTPNGLGGVCTSGPYEGHCEPAEPFRACQTGTDCPATGDSCRAEARRCFPVTGTPGDIVPIAASAQIPVRSTTHPVLGGFACAPPMRSSMANELLGLPGPVRLTVGGTLTFIMGGAL